MSLKQRIKRLEEKMDVEGPDMTVVICLGDRVICSAPEDPDLMEEVKAKANGGMAVVIRRQDGSRRKSG